MILDKKTNGQVLELYGLSADTKPVNAPNASIFYEIDTGNLFMYDAENKTWIEQ